jgi:hypothetical protein
MPMSIFASIHSDNQVEHPLLLLFSAKGRPLKPHRDVIMRVIMDRTWCVDDALLAIHTLAPSQEEHVPHLHQKGARCPLKA